MWIRAELKARARGILKVLYLKAFLVSLIISIASEGTSGRRGNGAGRWINLELNGNRGNLGPFNLGFGSLTSGLEQYFHSISVDIIIGVIIITGALLLKLFLGYPLVVGGSRFFLKAATEENPSVNVVLDPFRREGYLNVVKTMLYKGVLIILWSLLLIIPGIMKAYAYRMVPYILAENPNLNYKRALELSDEMTSGQKFDIFALDISFIGWYILGALAFGIGVIFVNPYINATNAELYLVLRQKALDGGYCTYDELVGE